MRYAVLTFSVALYLLFMRTDLFAAEVIRVGSNPKIIAISQEITRLWKVSDRVCILQE